MTRAKEHLPLTAILKKFIIIFLPALILIVSISVLANYFYSSSKLDMIKENQQHKINLSSEVLADEFQSVLSDLFILSSDEKVIQVFQGNIKAGKQHMGQTFLRFIRQKHMYDQIRLIDKKGMETVRVNYNYGYPYIVAKSELQDKSGRYYFKETADLEKKQVFISPFDLNIEHKKIELPLKPMIRFGTPIVDSKGRKLGILLFNYFGSRILDRIKRMDIKGQGRLKLINQDSYWLYSSIPTDNWGFMYPDQRETKFSSVFPEIWKKIQLKNTIQFESKAGLFSGQWIRPLQALSGTKTAGNKKITDTEKWFLLSRISEPDLKKLTNTLQQNLIIINVLMILVLLIISWVLAVMILRKNAAEKVQYKFEGVLEMAAAMSHELNQPLQAALTYVQILLSDLTEKDKNYHRLEKLNIQIEAMGQLTKELMQITQYKTKDYATGDTIVDIREASKGKKPNSEA